MKKEKVTGTIWHKLFSEKKNELNLSYRKLSEMTGIPHSTIAYYCNNECRIPYDNFIKLTKTLKIEL